MIFVEKEAYMGLLHGKFSSDERFWPYFIDTELTIVLAMPAYGAILAARFRHTNKICEVHDGGIDGGSR